MLSSNEKLTEAQSRIRRLAHNDNELVSLSFNDYIYGYRKKPLGMFGAQMLAGVMQYNSALTTLNLAYNEIGRNDTTYGAAAIDFLLKNNHSLTSLDVSHNLFNAQSTTLILNNLQDNKNLKSLNLSHNEYDAKNSLQSLGMILQSNTTLTYLDITGYPYQTPSQDTLVENIGVFPILVSSTRYTTMFQYNQLLFKTSAINEETIIFEKNKKILIQLLDLADKKILEQYYSNKFKELTDGTDPNFSILRIKLAGGKNISVYLTGIENQNNEQEDYFAIFRVYDRGANLDRCMYACEMLQKNGHGHYLAEQYKLIPFDKANIIEISELCPHGDLQSTFIPFKGDIKERTGLLIKYMKNLTELLIAFSESNVIFPDIKPSNFMINRDNKVVISDKKTLCHLDSFKNGYKKVIFLASDSMIGQLEPDTIYLKKLNEKDIEAQWVNENNVIKTKILDTTVSSYRHVMNYSFPSPGQSSIQYTLKNNFDLIEKIASLCNVFPSRMLDPTRNIVRFKSIMLTPAYSPPELLKPKNNVEGEDELDLSINFIDLKALQLYLLGITLYECVTGQRIAKEMRAPNNLHNFNFNHDVFHDEIGKIWSHIIQGLTNIDAGKRMSLEEADSFIKTISHIHEHEIENMASKTCANITRK